MKEIKIEQDGKVYLLGGHEFVSSKNGKPYTVLNLYFENSSSVVNVFIPGSIDVKSVKSLRITAGYGKVLLKI